MRRVKMKRAKSEKQRAKTETVWRTEVTVCCQPKNCESLETVIAHHDALITEQVAKLGQMCFAQWERRRETGAAGPAAEVQFTESKAVLPTDGAKVIDPPSLRRKAAAASGPAEMDPPRKRKHPARRSTAAGTALEQAVSGLGAEFRNSEATAASGLSGKQVSSLLLKRARRGWLENLGYGRWRKTAAWPKPRPGAALLEQIHGEIESKKPKLE